MQAVDTLTEDAEVFLDRGHTDINTDINPDIHDYTRHQLQSFVFGASCWQCVQAGSGKAETSR